VFDFLVSNNYYDTNYKDKEGKTLIQYAIGTDILYYIDSLVTTGADVEKADLVYAIEKNKKSEIIDYLTEKSSLSYKLTKYFNRIIDDKTTLSMISIGFALFVFLMAWLRKRKIQNQQNKTVSWSTTQDTKELEELRARAAEIKIDVENTELEADIIATIESDFKEKTKKVIIEPKEEKGLNYENSKKEPKVHITSEEIQKKLQAINQTHEEKTISDDILEQLEKDFK
jgi:hypothetical protein